ncbi:MAG: alpha/beta hydrolase fold [Rhodospirillales bacterium]|nr:alpha/beta hydrolase fold [Rhodospirillales bacterium]
MFEGFESKTVTTSGATIRAVIGGSGPPLLLLHGYPQTHVMWHKLAPRLAERFTVVASDLRGYGDSSKPPGGENHANYAKRAMALDQVELMNQLGFPRFRLVGHDRGGRVAHRLALDHPDAVSHVAVLDIAPTATMYAKTDRRFATAYFHWFFLIQPFDLPERLIGGDPDYYLTRNWRNREPGIFTDEAVAEYKRCFRDPATIHASCEDYRAAAGIDLEHDAADADRRIACPFLVLWGEQGIIGKLFDPIASWQEKALDVQGQPIPCGHYLPEEAPEATLTALLGFLGK